MLRSVWSIGGLATGVRCLTRERGRRRAAGFLALFGGRRQPVCGLDDLPEAGRVERGAPDEGGLAEEALGVVGLHAPAVEDAGPGGELVRDLREEAADHRVDLLRVLG